MSLWLNDEALSGACWGYKMGGGWMGMEVGKLFADWQEIFYNK